MRVLIGVVDGVVDCVAVDTPENRARAADVWADHVDSVAAEIRAALDEKGHWDDGDDELTTRDLLDTWPSAGSGTAVFGKPA